MMLAGNDLVNCGHQGSKVTVRMGHLRERWSRRHVGAVQVCGGGASQRRCRRRRCRGRRQCRRVPVRPAAPPRREASEAQPALDWPNAAGALTGPAAMRQALPLPMCRLMLEPAFSPPPDPSRLRPRARRKRPGRCHLFLVRRPPLRYQTYPEKLSAAAATGQAPCLAAPSSAGALRR